MENKKIAYVIQWRNDHYTKFSSHTGGLPPRRYASVTLAQTQIDEFIKADAWRNITCEYRVKSIRISNSSIIHVTSPNDIAFCVV